MSPFDQTIEDLTDIRRQLDLMGEYWPHSATPPEKAAYRRACDAFADLEREVRRGELTIAEEHLGRLMIHPAEDAGHLTRDRGD